MGTLQLLAGATVVGLVGSFANGAVLPMVSAIVICAAAAFVLGRLTLGGHAAMPAAAE
jgi:DHA1 family bicyclomycin/chloramphenicol resistance-like MFS transporter